jgi:hypothetical protein
MPHVGIPVMPLLIHILRTGAVAYFDLHLGTRYIAESFEDEFLLW